MSILIVFESFPSSQNYKTCRSGEGGGGKGGGRKGGGGQGGGGVSQIGAGIIKCPS